MRQDGDLAVGDAELAQMAPGLLGVDDEMVEEQPGLAVAQELQGRGVARPVQRQGIVHGEHEPGVAAEAAEEEAIEERQDEPLQVDDVRPVAGGEPAQLAQALQVLHALQHLACPGGAPAGRGVLRALVEEGREGEGLGPQLLVRAQAAADQRDLGAGGRERAAEMLVVGQGEERRVDDVNAHARLQAGGTAGPKRRSVGGRRWPS